MGGNMEDLTIRVKKMNEDCTEIVNRIKERGEVLPHLVMTMFSMRDAINELTVEVILLKEEVERNGKGEL